MALLLVKISSQYEQFFKDINTVVTYSPWPAVQVAGTVSAFAGILFPGFTTNCLILATLMDMVAVSSAQRDEDAIWGFTCGMFLLLVLIVIRLANRY